MNNPSLTSKAVEFFAPDGRFGKVYAQTDGQTLEWPNWPMSVCETLRFEIEQNPRVARGLFKMGVPVGIMELQVVAACRHGLYNIAADFDMAGRCTDIEVRTDCPHRNTCPGSGLVCIQTAQSPIGERITKSEMETALLVSEGLSNCEVAEKQHLAPSSIATRMSNILSKCGFNNRAQLTRWIISRFGIL